MEKTESMRSKEGSIEIEESLSSITISEDIKTQKSVIEKINTIDDTQPEINTSRSNSVSCEIEFNSTIPSDFNDDGHVFHFNFIHDLRDSKHCHQEFPCYPKLYKNGTRKSLTFSNEQMRDIERQNRILLQKILAKGPGSASLITKRNSLQHSQNCACTRRVSSATVNRRKQQRQIDFDNQVLKRKIDDIARRRKSYA